MLWTPSSFLLLSDGLGGVTVLDGDRQMLQMNPAQLTNVSFSFQPIHTQVCDSSGAPVSVIVHREHRATLDVRFDGYATYGEEQGDMRKMLLQQMTRGATVNELLGVINQKIREREKP